MISPEQHLIAMESAMDGMAILNDRSEYVYLNKAHAELYGYSSADELIGKTWHVLYQPEQQRWIENHVMPILRSTGRWRGQSIGKRKDGSLFHQELSLTGLQGGGLICVVRDSTEYHRKDQQLRARLRLEEIITDISTQFINLSLQEIDSAIQQALEEIGHFSGVDRSFLYQFHDEHKMVCTHQWSIPLFQYALDQYTPEQFPWLMGKIRRGEIVSVQDLRELPMEAQAEQRECERFGIHAFLLLPLHSSGKLFGYVGLQSQSSPRIWSEEHISLLRSSGGIFTHALNRMKSEQIIREAEERYRGLFENAMEGIFQSTPDGRYINVNPSLARMYGYSSPQALIDDMKDIGRQLYVDPERRLEFVRLLFEHDRVVGFESEIYRRDGTRFWISESARAVRNAAGRLLYYEGRVEDITHRKKALQDLEQSELRYRLLFDSNPQPMWLYDTATYRFLAVNQAAVEKYGYSQQEFLTKTIFDLRPPEEVSELKKYLEEMEKKGGVAPPRIWRHKRKNGTIFPVEVSSGPLVFSGRKARLVCIEDVTERLKAEEALRTSEEQLRQSQKMEAIGKLAGGIAHDFNNLLTAIMGYSDFIMQQNELSQHVRQSLDEIKKASERAGFLTRQLLAFSRKQVIQISVIDVNTIIMDLHKLLLRLIGEDIDLKTKLKSASSKVKGDPGQISQVIMNLVVNARDAMQNGGELIISTRDFHLTESDASAFSDLAPGNYLVISVSDTGCGMSPEVQSHIFEPFFTTKEAGKGTGLGLSTVYGIVKQCGGTIRIESQAGHGSRFDVYLPQSDDTSSPDIPSIPAPLIHSARGTILLAEDETTVRLLIREVLSSLGYEVLETSNGVEALQAIEHHQKPISLLITDVVMPRMNGPELAQKIRLKQPDLAILFISGYADDAVEKINISSAAFLPKPFTVENLVRKIRETISLSPQPNS